MHQLLNTRHVRSMDEVAFHHQIFVNELCRIRIIRVNTAHLCCCHVHLIDMLIAKKMLDVSLSLQIQFCMGTRDDLLITQRLQSAHNRRTHHTAVSCYKD
jgi:hypothetical protein